MCKFPFGIVPLLSLFFFFTAFLSPVFANCEDTVTKDNVDQIIADCNQKLGDISGQKKTLSATLAYLNTQITLTKTKIEKTQQALSELKTEINMLVEKIGDLNSSLDEISNTLLHRVRETYILSKDDPVYLFFASSGFQDFFSRYKYMKTIQNHDKEILTAMERIRSNYNVQKTDKQEKQDEMKKLNDQLNVQRISLASQQQEKQQLLEVTKNDERKYQQLREEARAQKRAFSRFVASQGGASILNNQTKCDDWGCYFNQRDAAWGNQFLGNSNLTLAEYGCLETSVAMVASHYKKDIKPSDIAANPLAFSSPDFDTALLLHDFQVKGVHVLITKGSASQLDDELNSGHIVIAGLYSDPPAHFIVIKQKTDSGYIMNDPFLENGSDRPLTDKYKVSDITSLRLVSFN